MRAGLSTIQQTLTPEAASVLNLSIAEASRRNHGQTTPLHVAATLLASPSGFLRQACIRSHPNSSHPLQCRALELCFSVALERLPTAQTPEPPGAAEPPISNALMAALKRAQAHQRRGCPEQQQQPLLAVKVELEQLIISILDDPSVSRVMREASFSSPAVKAAIEQSGAAAAHHRKNVNAAAAARNVYLNPRLGGGAAAAGEEVSKVVEIMSRIKKRNPILVGDTDAEAVVQEFLRKVANKEMENFKNVEIVSMDKRVLLSPEKNQVVEKMEDLGGLIEVRIRNGGVILDLGDLRWLVEQPVSLGGGLQQQVVVEMKKLLMRFGGAENGNNKFWLIGTATCETYLRCQVYHSSMENDWDLQAVPITSRSPIFPRLLSSQVGSLSSLKSMTNTNPLPTLSNRVIENSNSGQRASLCPQCSVGYEKEVAKLGAIEKSFSEAKQSSLPAWLQNAKTEDGLKGKDQGLLSKQKSLDLQKKWRDSCLNLHPSFHQTARSDRPAPPALSMATLYNPSLLSVQPKLQLAKPLGAALQLNTNQVVTAPKSPVHTDLNLGWKGADDGLEKGENRVKDLLGCISSEPQTKLLDKFSNALDADTYKKLLKGLMEKAWWQAEAASAVASAITRCRLGNGKRRGGGSIGDVWLLFTGPDRVGKKKMAYVIGEQVFGVDPVVIGLGRRRDDEEPETNYVRGKTSIDRIAEAVRRNPFLVIVLEDIDEADMLVRGSIKRAMERGRLTDSHGREVGLGNVVFIVTGDWSTMNPDSLRDGRFVDEKKVASMASGGWKLGLIVREKTAKRRPSWLQDEEEDRAMKPRREMGSGLSLDLNLTATFPDDEKTDGSNNSSDLTIDHDDELTLTNGHFSITSVPHDLATNVDDTIVFKPVSASFVRTEIRKTLAAKFATTVDENVSIEVEDDVLEKILGGLWHDRSSLEEWIERVVAPSFDQLKTRLSSAADRSGSVVRLVVESSSIEMGKSHGNGGEWLPSSIVV